MYNIKFVYKTAVLLFLLFPPFCLSENISRKQNGSYENVIEIPISVFDMLVKNKNHVSDQNLKNNYYTLPVVYTLAPVLEDSTKYDKEKRKNDKVLLTPLYFSYNQQKQDGAVHIPGKLTTQSPKIQNGRTTKSPNTEIQPPNHRYPTQKPQYDYYDLYFDQNNEAYFLPSTSTNSGLITSEKPTTQSTSYVKFVDIDRKKPDNIVTKYNYNTNHSSVVKRDNDEKNISKPSVTKKTKAKSDNRSKQLKKTSQNRKLENESAPKIEKRRSKYQLTTSKSTSIKRKHDAPKNLAKDDRSYLRKSKSQQQSNSKASEEENISQQSPKVASSNLKSSKILPEKPNLKLGSAEKRSSSQESRKTSNKSKSSSQKLQNQKSETDERTNLKNSPTKTSSSSETSSEHTKDTSNNAPKETNASSENSESVEVEDTSSETEDEPKVSFTSEKYRVQITSNKKKPIVSKEKDEEEANLDQDFTPEESTTVVYKSSQTLPKKSNQSYNQKKSSETQETAEDSAPSAEPDTSVEIDRDIKKQKIPSAKFKFELDSIDKETPKVSTEHDSNENFRKIGEKQDEDYENTEESPTNLKKSYRDPEKEYNNHHLPKPPKKVLIQRKNDDVIETSTTYVPKTVLDYDIFEEIFPERFKSKNGGQSRDDKKYLEPSESNTNERVLSKRKSRKTNRKNKIGAQKNEDESSTRPNLKNYEVTEPFIDITTKYVVVRPERKVDSSRRSKNEAPVEDVSPASSDNAPEQTKALPQKDSVVSEQKHAPEAHKDHHHKKGGGKEHHSEHHGDQGDKKKSGHKGDHKSFKKEVGHHDKKEKKGGYKDKGGHEKKHHKEDGYFGEHKEGAEGEKGSEFKESGEHKKGHSTQGEHNVHKKEEYSKTKHFFDEDHEEGEHEKHGGYHHEHNKKKGGKEKHGHLDGGYKDHHYGKKGKHAKGVKYHEDKGHKDGGGHKKHHHHYDKYAKKDDHDDHKKWSYKKGHKEQKG